MTTTATLDDVRLCAAPGCSEPVPPSRTRPRRYHSPACKRAADVAGRRTVRAVERPGSLIPWSPSWGGAFVGVDPAILREVLIEDLEAQGLAGYSLCLMADTPEDAEFAAAVIEAAAESRLERMLSRRPLQEDDDVPPRPVLRGGVRAEPEAGPDAGPEEREVLREIRRAERLGREDGSGAEGSGRRPTRREPRRTESLDPGAYSVAAHDRLPMRETIPTLPTASRDEQDRISPAFAEDGQRVGATMRAARRMVPSGVVGGHGGYCEVLRRRDRVSPEIGV